MVAQYLVLPKLVEDLRDFASMSLHSSYGSRLVLQFHQIGLLKLCHMSGAKDSLARFSRLIILFAISCSSPFLDDKLSVGAKEVV